MLTDADIDRILDRVHEEGREISQTCRQMLHAFDGHDVMWQGLAIAELVARWISAHPAGMPRKRFESARPACCSACRCEQQASQSHFQE